jgi:hypothetical protein
MEGVPLFGLVLANHDVDVENDQGTKRNDYDVLCLSRYARTIGFTFFGGTTFRRTLYYYSFGGSR